MADDEQDQDSSLYPMSPDEMRKQGIRASRLGHEGDHAVWFAGAEICGRLDDIIGLLNQTELDRE